MYISAGRTTKSKYDSRVPVHIAMQSDYDEAPLSLCGGREVTPSEGVQVSVTCSKCLSLVNTIPDMCRIPADARSFVGLQAAG